MITLTPEMVYSILIAFVIGLTMGALLGKNTLVVFFPVVGLIVGYSGYLTYTGLLSGDIMVFIGIVFGVMVLALLGLIWPDK